MEVKVLTVDLDTLVELSRAVVLRAAEDRFPSGADTAIVCTCDRGCCAEVRIVKASPDAPKALPMLHADPRRPVIRA